MGRTRRKHGSGAAVDFGTEDTRNTLEKQVFDEYKRRTSVVKIIIILAVILAFLSFGMVMGNASRINEAIAKAESVSAHTGNEQPGKSAALRNVNAWLTGSNTPFPAGVSNIMWDGAVKTADYTDNAANTPVNVQHWVHTFEFTDHAGNVRRVSQITVVRDGVASAPNDPSILPPDATAKTSGQSTKPNGHLSLDNSNTLDNLIKTWAKAYVGKDMNAFTVLIADPDTNHIYQPANLGTLENVGQNWAVWQTKPDSDDTDKARSGYAVVSVTLNFRPYPNTDDATNTQTTQTQTARTTLSLLVKDPQSGSAKIVDWGADGMIDTLKPYANALAKDAVATTNTTTDDDTTTTPGSGDTPTPQAANLP